MSVTLGSASLSDDLVLLGLDNAPSIKITQRRTLTGRSIVHTAPVAGGRTLTLQSERHLDLADVDAVRAIMAAGQPVTLNHHRGTFTVLVVDTALQQDDVSLHSNPTSGEWYSGDIILLEV